MERLGHVRTWLVSFLEMRSGWLKRSVTSAASSAWVLRFSMSITSSIFVRRKFLSTATEMDAAVRMFFWGEGGSVGVELMRE